MDSVSLDSASSSVESKNGNIEQFHKSIILLLTVFNYEVTFFYLKMYEMGFPDGSVVKNLPANAGDTGSIPGLRRALMPWSN